MSATLYPYRLFLQSEDAGKELVDSHCHLDLEPLFSKLQQTLQEADTAGVTACIVPGVHPNGWQRIHELASEYPQIVPAFGVHPMHAAVVDDHTMLRLSELAPSGIAIGEIGLDPTYAVSRTCQENVFREQIRLAHKRGMPLLIHCRRHFQRTLQLMREERADQLGGIMHAFSGSVEMAREFIRLGFAISICGTVTWNSAVKPLRLARELPLECLVLETDAPDMTPQQYRGSFNRPSWMVVTASRLADIKGIRLETVIKTTTANVRRILRLPVNKITEKTMSVGLPSLSDKF
jgi:TatD DNase family protein